MSGPMNLVYPVNGDTMDTWGTVLNTLLGLVEAHDHTTNKGSKVPSAGININADLSFGGFGITAAKTFSFTPVATSTMTGYAGALFINSADSELYYRTIAGTNVKFTSGAALNVAGFTGGIGGDYSAVSALFSYDDATRRYLAQQELSGGLRPWAGVAMGPVDLYQPAVSIVNRVRLQSPSALATSYVVTFPAAVPAATAFVQADTAGTLTFASTPTLSGTNYIKRGSRTIRIPLRSSMAATISGAGATNPTVGAAGASCPASSSNTFCVFPESADFMLSTITSVKVWAAVSGGSVTFSLQDGTSGGNFVTIGGATGSTSSLSQYTAITLTPTVPYVIGSNVGTLGNCLGININCAAAVTCNVSVVDIITTVT